MATPPVEVGISDEEMINALDRIGAGLIGTTSHQQKLQSYSLRPNAASVMRHAKVSVMLAAK